MHFELSCPVPVLGADHVQLAHGGGGRAMHRLIEQVFSPAFGQGNHDSAVLTLDAGRVAFTTDTYVVNPLFFPGGDIGQLAVFGTVNDLAMAGARPLALSAAFVLEEGLEMSVLRRVVDSIASAARECGVQIVTGDTKVVDRGHGDGIFINTAGLGVVPPDVDVSPSRVAPGDAIILSGDVGRHGLAIMSVREGLQFESTLESDCAPLHELAAAALRAGVSEIHCMRDLTRGGLVSALNEIALSARVDMEVDEAAVPVCEEVGGACQLLGLDPMHVANEGRMVVFASAAVAERVVAAMQVVPVGRGTAQIGRVANHHDAASGRVILRTTLGNARLLDMLNGEQLPRIC